jgi:hypothetical protein
MTEEVAYGKILSYVNKIRVIDLSRYFNKVNNINSNEGNVKKVRFALKQAMKAQRGSRCIALLFL